MTEKGAAKTNDQDVPLPHRPGSTDERNRRRLKMEIRTNKEGGTYEELIEKNGYFAELVARQRLDDK